MNCEFWKWVFKLFQTICKILTPVRDRPANGGRGKEKLHWHNNLFKLYSPKTCIYYWLSVLTWHASRVVDVRCILDYLLTRRTIKWNPIYLQNRNLRTKLGKVAANARPKRARKMIVWQSTVHISTVSV